jgi:hypothetical protein
MSAKEGRLRIRRQHGDRRNWTPIGLALILALLAGTGSARAEVAVQLRVSRGPYHVGMPVEMHVHVTGFERSPDPRCEAAAPEGGTMVMTGLVPNISTSMQIIGGRVSRSESVTFICQFRFTPTRVGRFRFEPFRVSQATLSVASAPHALEVEEAPLDPQIRVRIEVSEAPVYIGQRVPIRIEWWLEDSLQDHISSYRIQSELFDREDAFRFLPDEQPQRGDQTLDIVTAQGDLSLRATVERRNEDGTDFLVVAAERTLIPLRDGRFDLPPATLQVEEVVRWQRDLFGGRRPAASHRIFARDESRRLIVRPAPATGRPAHFAGAVGRGFALDVVADRSVVQVGDPITLTLTVRGDGHLDAVGLPDWGAGDGLPTDRFRLSEGNLSGEVRGDTKIFRLGVRVLDDSVREIPALPFSWFDPELGEYQTTHSRPVAVSVRPAQVIGADDVLASTEPRDGRAEAAPGTRADDPVPRQGSLSISGADLSIETDPTILLRRSGGRASLRAAAYTGSLALIGAALWVKRRRNVPAEIMRLRVLVRRQRDRIRGATTLPPREALAEIAAALRELASGVPGASDASLEDFVRECDEILYSPGAEPAGMELPERVARAQAILDAIEEQIG